MSGPTDPRSLGALAAPFFSKNVVDRSVYVKLEFGSGTRYYTDRNTDNSGQDVRDIGDGSGSQTWKADRHLLVAALSQDEENPLDVQSIDIGNGDFLYTAYAIAPAGIRDVPIDVWVAGFDASGAFVEAKPFYLGTLDGGDFPEGGVASISLRAFTKSYQQDNPSVRFTKGAFKLMLSPNTKIPWGDHNETAQGQGAVNATVPKLPLPSPPPPTRATSTIIPVTNTAPALVTRSGGVTNPTPVMTGGR